jgi:hypothetical protein
MCCHTTSSESSAFLGSQRRCAQSSWQARELARRRCSSSNARSRHPRASRSNAIVLPAGLHQPGVMHVFTRPRPHRDRRHSWRALVFCRLTAAAASDRSCNALAEAPQPNKAVRLYRWLRRRPYRCRRIRSQARPHSCAGGQQMKALSSRSNCSPQFARKLKAPYFSQCFTTMIAGSHRFPNEPCAIPR